MTPYQLSPSDEFVESYITLFLSFAGMECFRHCQPLMRVDSQHSTGRGGEVNVVLHEKPEKTSIFNHKTSTLPTYHHHHHIRLVVVTILWVLKLFRWGCYRVFVNRNICLRLHLRKSHKRREEAEYICTQDERVGHQFPD